MNWALFVVWKVYVPRFRVRMTTRTSPERLARASYGDLSIVRCILVDCIYSANVHYGVFFVVCNVYIARFRVRMTSRASPESLAPASYGDLKLH